jgi:hypothetical protein
MDQNQLVQKCNSFIDTLQTPNLQQDQIQAIKTLVLKHKPKTILEVGVNDLLSDFWDTSPNSFGATSTRILLCLKYILSTQGVSGELYSIDKIPVLGNQKIIDSELGGLWKPLLGKPSNQIIWNGPNIDFFFVDGNHSLLGCLTDLEYFEKYFSKRIIIVLHDFADKDREHEVKSAANKFVNTRSQYKLTEIVPTYPMGLIGRKRIWQGKY